MDFKESLRYYRKLRGYTQKELSELVGMSRATITAYETGSRNPGIEELEKLSDALNADLNSLTGNSKDPAVSSKLNAELVRDLMKLNDEQIQAVRNLVKAFLYENQ